MIRGWSFKGIAGLFMLGLVSASCGANVVIDKDHSSGDDTNSSGDDTSCADGLTNGLETDVDCGGACPQRCNIGRSCASDADCASGSCSGGTCSASTPTPTPTPTPTSATCKTYCTAIMTACQGNNAQYVDELTCQAVCKAFSPGKVGDMAGNSLECRAYHAAAAAVTMKPEVHCAHSGLTGGDLDPSATGAQVDGPCGNGVETFCQLAVDTCKGQPGAWVDVAACTSEAKKFPKSTTPFSATKDVTGNTFNCRAYHLIVATQKPEIHCAHIKLDSLTCK